MAVEVETNEEEGAEDAGEEDWVDQALDPEWEQMQLDSFGYLADKQQGQDDDESRMRRRSERRGGCARCVCTCPARSTHRGW